MHQFLKTHLWAPAAAQITCPAAMSDGAARLLSAQLARPDLPPAERAVFAAALARLVERDPAAAWTSGQWMTERPGGSDVRATETQAALAQPPTTTTTTTDAAGMPLGPYAVDGFKWFSSATDAQMTVLLARLPDGSLSAFYAPMRRRRRRRRGEATTELNGIRVQRLKSKLGTRPVPTAELELAQLRAWRVGAPGHGVREISTILNITRAHNAVGAVGFLGRGLAVAKAYARVRRVRGGELLMDNALHVRTLALWGVEYAAMMQLAFATAALLGVAENRRGGGGSGVEWLDGLGVGEADAVALLRLLTPMAKALTARVAIAGLAECMESLGGVGFLENEDPELNLARLFRDANVLSIWEGTTNVLADDMVRVVKGREGDKVLDSLAKLVAAVVGLGGLAGSDVAGKIKTKAEQLMAWVLNATADDLRAEGRKLLADFGWVVCAVLLAVDATRDGDEAAWEVLRRWTRRTDGWPGAGFEKSHVLENVVSTERLRLDKLIVFGEHGLRETGKL